MTGPLLAAASFIEDTASSSATRTTAERNLSFLFMDFQHHRGIGMPCGLTLRNDFTCTPLT
jgi:hypothetical protein